MPGTGSGSKTTSGLLHLLSRLRSYFLWAPLVFLYTGVLGTCSLVSSFFDRRGKIQHSFARMWAWMILKTFCLPVKITGMEGIDRIRPYVYAANHISALDIPVLYRSLPFQFRIMAKRELFRYPFLGWHLRRSGQIAVDASNARASLRSLNRAVADLREGMPLVVFPEGGRSPHGRVLPFMGGPFYVAIKAGVDIVPMAIVGTYETLPMETFHVKPRRLRLIVGKPISSSGYSLKEMDQLGEKVRSAIEDLYYANSVIQPFVVESAP